MNKPDELLDELLDAKGRKAPKAHYKFAASKNQRKQHANFNTKPPHRTRGELLLTAAKMPQAVLKISGYCKGVQHANKHINYITRHGKLELVISDGSSVKGTTASKELIDSWAVDFANRKNSRDVAKIVLSLPENSCPEKLKKAAGEFLADEFGETNDYAFVLHTDTKKPHVHVMVKMVGYNGKKLDPRKNYIEQLRRDFAKFCRLQGILVEASRRYHRGLNGKSKNTPVVQMRKRKHHDIKVDNKLNLMVRHQSTDTNHNVEVVPVRNKTIRTEYLKAAIDFHELSTKSKDNTIKNQYIKAASVLLNFAKNLPTERRFLAKIMSMITVKKRAELHEEKHNIVKAYKDVLATFDLSKKMAISKIEQQNIQSSNLQKHNLKSELDLDI